MLGFVMAALLVLCLIVIGYLISRVKKGNSDAFKLSEVSIFPSKLMFRAMLEVYSAP